MIHIETTRLLLRNVTPADAGVMFDYRNNPICAKYQRGQKKELSEILALTEARQQDSISDLSNFFVAVSLKDSCLMIGEIVVMPNDGCFSIARRFPSCRKILCLITSM